MEVVNLYGPEFQAAPLQFVCADSEHSDIFAGTTNRLEIFWNTKSLSPMLNAIEEQISFSKLCVNSLIRKLGIISQLTLQKSSCINNFSEN